MSNDDILINLNVALLKSINSAVKARINMCSACFRAIADMKKTFKCLNRTCKETHVVFKEDERCLKVQERIKLPSDPSRTGQKMEKQAYMNMFMEYLDKLQMTVAERKKRKKKLNFLENIRVENARKIYFHLKPTICVTVNLRITSSVRNKTMFLKNQILQKMNKSKKKLKSQTTVRFMQLKLKVLIVMKKKKKTN